MKLAEINEVIKASPAIQIQSKISLLQRRAWNVLLANAYNELPDKDIHSVSMVELAAKLGFDSGNQEYLKEVLRSLRSCEVEWNLLNKDNKQVWGVASLLASAEIENGICTYGFAPHLRLKLHNPRIYAKLNLRLQNRFKGQYALILWEVCFDYFDTDRGQGETPFIPLETFRELIGLKADEYPVFGILNRDIIKPAIKEINDVTDYLVEVEQKRIGRKIAELKFRITKVKQIPLQESVFPDIENLPPVAIELVQAEIDRKMAQQIADAEWDFVNPQKLSPPGTYPDFLAYITEKIEMSLSAADVKNRAGFIVEAIRENYQDPVVQKDREVRAEKVREKELEDLMAEFKIKRDNILRQAVHTQPELVEQAAEKITSYIIRERLLEHDTAMAAYQKGGMVKAEIDGILAAEFCQDLLTAITTIYNDEKARILGGIG
ncbi:MAG: replication initiation protein [Candidatus Poribacteria bacterium]|nr:replication initiation protein [Candidatus Poribacteria bacterium]MDE0326810.1 replication initiation protein [Candidatus Poribacteria bacterium]